MSCTYTGSGIFICGSAWGLGIYKTNDPESEFSDLYGFPPTNMNPFDYIPDREACTEKEIAAWEQAKLNWMKNAKESEQT